jgi:hypothetical protein
MPKHPPAAQRTASQMYPLIEAYLESGLSQKQFYQQHNLSLDVFQYWLRPEAVRKQNPNLLRHEFYLLTK